MAFLQAKFISLLVITFLCWSIRSSSGLRILGLFPFHVRSHFVMCEELMRGLATKGHQVDVYSHFPLKKSVPNYTDFSLKGSVSPISNNLTFDEASIGSITELMKYWFECGTALCNLMKLPVFQKLLHELPTDPAYDLIITELSVIHCYLPWGRHLNVPIIAVVTPPLLDWHYDAFGTPINLATDSSILSPYVAPMTFLERLDNVYTYYSVKRMFEQYVREQDKYVEKFFGPGYPNVIDLQRDVALVLVNHDIALSGIRPFAPIVVPVGGLHVVDHNETLPEIVQKWLDESKDGCIYFSFGSMTRIETFPRHILDAFYKSFKNIAPVRVLLKIAKPQELPPGLPTNVLTQPWFQQIQVLKHKNIKVFVTHGGLMGTQESIYFGVPMVAIPLFGDQKFNAETYAKKKIAINVNLHDVTEKRFTNGLKEIIKNRSYKKAVQKISSESKDRPLSPIDTAEFWMGYIHRHGKDALKSPVVDMPWWQARLLDVYGFIISTMLLALYIVIKLIKFLSSKLCSRSKLKIN